MLELAGFHQPSQLPLPEASNSLLNILFHEEAARNSALEGSYFDLGLETLEKADRMHADMFSRLRFIFLCTVDADGARRACDRPGTLKMVLEIAQDMVKDTKNNYACLVELLRILFNVTAEDLPAYFQPELFSLAQKFTALPSSDIDTLTMQSEAAVLFLNLSPEFIRSAEIPAGPLLSLIEGTLEAESDSRINVHAVLLAVAKLAKEQASLRHHLRKSILPAKWYAKL